VRGSFIVQEIKRAWGEGLAFLGGGWLHFQALRKINRGNCTWMCNLACLRMDASCTLPRKAFTDYSQCLENTHPETESSKTSPHAPLNSLYHKRTCGLNPHALYFQTNHLWLYF